MSARRLIAGRPRNTLGRRRLRRTASATRRLIAGMPHNTLELPFVLPEKV